MNCPENYPLYPLIRAERNEAYVRFAFGLFQAELLKWKQSLLDQTDQTLKSLADEAINTAEATDRASLETNKAFEYTRDRSRKLIGKIDPGYSVLRQANTDIASKRARRLPAASKPARLRP